MAVYVCTTTACSQYEVPKPTLDGQTAYKLPVYCGSCGKTCREKLPTGELVDALGEPEPEPEPETTTDG